MGKTEKEITLTARKKKQMESVLGHKLVCEYRKCGKELKVDDEIISKITHGGNPGRRRRYYHKKCWNALFV